MAILKKERAEEGRRKVNRGKLWKLVVGSGGWKRVKNEERKVNERKKRELHQKVEYSVLAQGCWEDKWNAHDLRWAPCPGVQTRYKHNILFILFLTEHMKRALSHSIAEQCSIIQMKLDVNY